MGAIGVSRLLEDPIVLVLDDEPEIVSELTDWLFLKGIPCVGAAKPEAALDLIARHETVRLVLLDRRMPLMDGYEFVRRARMMLKSGSGLQFLMITGHLTEADFADARSHGFCELCPKPVDVAQLEVLLHKRLAAP